MLILEGYAEFESFAYIAWRYNSAAQSTSLLSPVASLAIMPSRSFMPTQKIQHLNNSSKHWLYNGGSYIIAFTLAHFRDIYMETRFTAGTVQIVGTFWSPRKNVHVNH